MLMDQSSRDDTLVGVGPPGAAPAGAVSRQSSRDKRRKRSAGGSSMEGEGRAISAIAQVPGSFVREQLRAPLTLLLLVAIPAFFVLILASVLGRFGEALGGTLAGQSATAISAGWAAAFLSGTLAFFQVASSRGADRRLAAAGLGAAHVAVSRIAAAVALGVASAPWRS